MIEEKIKTVISTIFNVPVNDISEETSLDTLKSWDSLGHMNLVIALEEEFGLHFEPEQIIEMNSYPLLVCIVKETLINNKSSDFG